MSHSFYMAHKAEFYEFYRAKMLAPDAQPNAAHRKLAQWEQEGRLKAVITQNIDGLHQKAGNREVLELHGSVLRNYCERCHKFYGLDAILHSTGVPKCACGGDIKPDVVLYEEGLDEDVMDKALRYIHDADMLIIGGTSLVVYPAAGLVRYYRGPQAGGHQQGYGRRGHRRGSGHRRAHRPGSLPGISPGNFRLDKYRRSGIISRYS